jgi:hypothetical protein
MIEERLDSKNWQVFWSKQPGPTPEAFLGKAFTFLKIPALKKHAGLSLQRL